MPSEPSRWGDFPPVGTRVVVVTVESPDDKWMVGQYGTVVAEPDDFLGMATVDVRLDVPDPRIAPSDVNPDDYVFWFRTEEIDPVPLLPLFDPDDPQNALPPSRGKAGG